jgi:hypothetical protein
MKTIEGQANVNLAITKEVILAMQDDYKDLRTTVTSLFPHTQYPDMIVSGVFWDNVNGYVLGGWVIMGGVLMPFIGGAYTGKVKVFVEDELVKEGFDASGNPYYSKITKTYCANTTDQSGTPFDSLVRFEFATKTNTGTDIVFDVQSADQPFTIVSVSSKKNQFGRYILNMQVSAAAQVWPLNWYRISALPAAAIPTEDKFRSATVSYFISGVTHSETVPIRASAAGFLEMYFSPGNGDSFALTATIQIEYDL